MLGLARTSSDAASSTTSAAWVLKVGLTVPAYTGVVRIGYAMEYNAANNNKQVAVRFENTTDTITLGGGNQSTNASTNYFQLAGFVYVTFTGAAKTFELQYTQISGTTCVVQNARIEAWRVT